MAKGLRNSTGEFLRCLADNQRPIGLKTLAVSVGEEETTIEDVYEPFLIQKHLLIKTPQGRCLSVAGYQHLGLTPPEEITESGNNVGLDDNL